MNKCVLLRVVPQIYSHWSTFRTPFAPHMSAHEMSSTSRSSSTRKEPGTATVAPLHDKVQHAWSEQGKATAYDDYRPNYHSETIKYIRKLFMNRIRTKENPRYQVLEIGAGTGKFTRKIIDELSNHGKSALNQEKTFYVAVEPLLELSNKLQESIPIYTNISFSVLNCSAENLQVEDNSVGCVICPQSFHWFANDRALTEIHRVLIPGGLLVLVWNSRDVSDPLVKAINDIYLEFYVDGKTPRQGDKKWLALFDEEPKFTQLEQHVQNVVKHEGDREFIVNYMATISVISSLSAEDKQKTLDRIRQVLDSREPSSSIISLPMFTEIYHCNKV